MATIYFQLLSRIVETGARARRDDQGATAVEYGLMVALIAVAIVVTVGFLGIQLNTLFDTVLQSIS